MFEHSVRVPRNFKISANIVKKVATEGGGVKNLLYDNKLRHFRTNVIYALITETIKHAAHIDKLFEATGILEKEQRLDPWLARVLTTELLFGKKELPGFSKPEQAILSYKEQFEKIPVQHDEVKSEVRRPRYVRINTNLLTTSDAIGAFQDEGYRFIRCTSASYNDYLQQIQGLSEYDFTQDYHIKTMMVFHPGTKFHNHELYLENKIILQDKATALPVQLLAPPPGSVVLDMCAAPGMKTTQVAAFMRNQGKVYAVERNESRYQTLCDFVEKTESKCVTTMHRDSLEIKRGDCDDVEYIILDPSCSGSGMQLSVHNYVEDVRLARLTSLQEKFLKHAMNSFPKAKKIVYSTCSIFPEENERVISNVVKSSRAKWKVLNVKDLLKEQWNNYGSGMYGEMGTRCLYARPESDMTTGFFLAVLERDLKQENVTGSNEVADDELDRKKAKKNKKHVSEDTSPEAETNEQNGGGKSENHKKKKKSKHGKDRVDEVIVEGGEITTHHESSEGVKRRNKRVETGSENVVDCVEDINAETDNFKQKKKKKKKDKDLSEVSENQETSLNNDGVISTEVNLEETELPKKKKKRSKNNELIENDDVPEGTEKDIHVDVETESSTKKGKKSKHSPELVHGNDEVEPVKKKKKKRTKE
ncbi:28S rRNA (cytosine-C(5))-methyltransferase [Zerene cesonia]|uniref:28S rRNA (cytosine-C(5))-methyltransferase n=1 Tax=Zerene cesonia TaxID=33412 RepID=UPI0018E531C3|nr:28S rRNA (cytosine-C(5))-methyltransferase [Zerene cesonia]